MKTNKMLPVLERQCIAGTTWRYCIQKITQYDDGHVDPYSCGDYIGAWNSDTGDIDKAMEDIYRREKEFCDYNIVNPFTLTLRKVAIECKMEVIDEKKSHFGSDDYQPLHCAECGSTIQYGNEFLTDTATNNVYCNAECYMESRNVVHHDSCDGDYKSHFMRK